MNHHRLLLLIMSILFLGALLAPLALAVVPTRSAGIGVEDRVENGAYSLKLIFSEKSGVYVADMDVRIFDTENKLVLHDISQGPWLFVDLPDGMYRVEATRHDGQFQGASFIIDGIQKRVGLVFSKMVDMPM